MDADADGFNVSSCAFLPPLPSALASTSLSPTFNAALFNLFDGQMDSVAASSSLYFMVGIYQARMKARIDRKFSLGESLNG